jgi:hypothetical protein
VRKSLKVVENLLYTHNFFRILSFIKGDQNIKTKDIITSIDKDFMLYDEKIRGKRLLAHFITFKAEEDKIISEITFFGKIIYTVILGELPDNLKSDNFGCGHLFHPFLKTIHNLTQEPPLNPTPEQIKTSFGLYKRI